MDSDIRVLHGSEFKEALYADLEKLMGSVMGYSDEINRNISDTQKNENLCELMDLGAICGPDGKRIPSKKGASQEQRSKYLSEILMSGKPLYIYKKGEVYPREVTYNFETGRVETRTRDLSTEMPRPRSRKPNFIAMAWNRRKARNGGTPSKEYLEWQRYEDWKTAKKNAMDEKRVRRRRRNDALMSGGYLNSGLDSGRKKDKHIGQTFVAQLKGYFGYGRELGAKGTKGLDELLTDGSIVDAYGKPLFSSKLGNMSRDERFAAIGNRLRTGKQAVYIYKPGEKYPHEMFLDEKGLLRISRQSIDQISNDRIKAPTRWQGLMDGFGRRNPAAFKYGRMLNRKRILKNAESEEWKKRREELDKKHGVKPKQTDKTKAQLKKAVEQKKQREKQTQQPAPQKQQTQPQKQQTVQKTQTQPQQEVQKTQPQPEVQQPKPAATSLESQLAAQLAALQEQNRMMMERMAALEEQLRQQQAVRQQPAAEVKQPVAEQKQPVTEQKQPAAEEKAVPAEQPKQENPVKTQPKKGWDLSIGSGGQVQLDAVRAKEPEERLEAPKVVGEGERIEFNPRTGEYVRFDAFYMNAPDEYFERYRIREGHEPPQDVVDAIMALGNTGAGWTGIRQEMAEQQTRMEVELAEKQNAYDLQQARAALPKSNAPLESPDVLIQRLEEKFPDQVTDRVRENIRNLHAKACESYDTLESACAQPGQESVSAKDQVRGIVQYNYLSKGLSDGVVDKKDVILLDSPHYQNMENRMLDGASRSVGYFKNPKSAEAVQKNLLTKEGIDKITGIYATEKKTVLSSKSLDDTALLAKRVKRLEHKPAVRDRANAVRHRSHAPEKDHKTTRNVSRSAEPGMRK